MTAVNPADYEQRGTHGWWYRKEHYEWASKMMFKPVKHDNRSRPGSRWHDYWRPWERR